MTAALIVLANLWPHLLALTAAIVVGFYVESLWQQGNRRLDALLADTDADLDAQMVAACQREADRELLADCNDCGLDVDPNDAAPSCGAHQICVSCYTTGDFRCGQCLTVARWIELDDKLLRRDAEATS